MRTAGEVAAPGTLAAHYAPRTAVEIVDAHAVAQRVHEHLACQRRAGVLTFGSVTPDLPDQVVVLDAPRDVEEYARVLVCAPARGRRVGPRRVARRQPTLVGRPGRSRRGSCSARRNNSRRPVVATVAASVHDRNVSTDAPYRTVRQWSRRTDGRARAPRSASPRTASSTSVTPDDFPTARSRPTKS